MEGGKGMERVQAGKAGKSRRPARRERMNHRPDSTPGETLRTVSQSSLDIPTISMKAVSNSGGED
jgi:hypothetical protein